MINSRPTSHPESTSACFALQVYVYYELQSFYQNHKRYALLVLPNILQTPFLCTPEPCCHLLAVYFRYVRSLVSAQLGGKNKAPNTLGTCAPQQYVNDMENAVDPSNNAALIDSAAVDPCGLMPYSYFNDSYVMSQQQPGGALTVVDMDVSPSCSSSSAYSLAIS